MQCMLTCTLLSGACIEACFTYQPYERYPRLSLGGVSVLGRSFVSTLCRSAYVANRILDRNSNHWFLQ
jgi:hypothetical protein